MHPCFRTLRRTGAMLVLALASLSSQALSVDDARHLLTRTGFGAAPHELREMLPLTREQAVQRVMASLDARPVLAPPPTFLTQALDGYAPRLGAQYLPASMAPMAQVNVDEAVRLTKLGQQEMEQLRAWWLDRMVSTPAPFAERLALLWHGHFTSKYFDVDGPRLMYDQLVTIQTQGSRNFATLMHAMLRDPAMLIFLDNAFNTRDKPNENLARELMELFTLGVGHYSEADVKVLGRKMAGYTVDFEGDWRFKLNRDELDLTPQRFLGRSVRTLDDAEQAILAQPQTARWIATRFYREFVDDHVDAVQVERLAAELRRHGYALRPMLHTLLSSEAFWSPAHRGNLVKSPVELIVGAVRTLGLPLPEAGRLVQDTRLLGQELFEPPTVKGWRQGMGWLNMVALKQRSDSLAALWRCRQSGADAVDADAGDLLVRFSSERQGDAPVRLRVRIDGREVAHAEARCPGDLSAQPAAGGVLKPAWETLRVPRARLGADPQVVEVVFDRAPGTEANVFVNWIQLGGARLPATVADQRYPAGQACSGQEPMGMLYCSASMRFDLPVLRQTQARVDPTLYDRQFGRFGAVIETGTARQPLQLQPAARHGVDPRRYDETWQGLPLTQALLPVAPMTTQLAAAEPLTTRLEALLFDPAFNLK